MCVAVDLLEKMLMFSPSKRLTLEEAMAHPYLASLHDPSDEPIMDPATVQQFDFSFERQQLTTDAFRELVYEEMCKYHPEMRSNPVPVPVNPAPQSYVQNSSVFCLWSGIAAPLLGVCGGLM